MLYLLEKKGRIKKLASEFENILQLFLWNQKIPERFSSPS
jgi:hypothetical protein